MSTARPIQSAGDPATPIRRGWPQLIAGTATAGAIAAVVIVYAYYNDPWRPLAHALGIWAVLATAVAFRRPLRQAVGAAVSFLAAAVVSFYVGLKVGHDIRWADSGSVMGVNWEQIQLWLVLAVAAGAVFGLLGAVAAWQDWRGAAATAVLLGLLLGDAWRRGTTYRLDVAVAVDLLAAVVVFVIAARANRHPALTLGLTVITSGVGFLVVSAPDFIEQLMIEGF